MKYKVYYKEDKVVWCNADTKYILNMSKDISRYPFAFSSSISVDISNNLVTLDVTPLNERSASKLNSVSPCISKYTRNYRPRDSETLNARYKVGKNRHWIWSADTTSVTRFMQTETTSTGKRYKIALDQIDTRLLNENYGKTQGLKKETGEVHYSLQSFIIAFRIVLLVDNSSFRFIHASLPKYIYFDKVGGGDFNYAEETTYEDFASRHSKF